jgi:hypothetical protein
MGIAPNILIYFFYLTLPGESAELHPTYMAFGENPSLQLLGDQLSCPAQNIHWPKLP